MMQLVLGIAQISFGYMVLEPILFMLGFGKIRGFLSALFVLVVGLTLIKLFSAYSYTPTTFLGFIFQMLISIWSPLWKFLDEEDTP